MSTQLRFPSVWALALASSLSLPVHADANDVAEALRIVGEVNKLTEQLKVANPDVVLVAPTPRADNQGAFLSPYKADGTLTAWAEKGMSASVGGAVGGAIGGKAASALAAKIPFAGGFLGRKAKEKATATGTVMAAGGMDFIKESSDISFDTAEDLAVYLQAKHAGVDTDFAKALGTAFGIYPALKTTYEPTVKAAIEAAKYAPAAPAEPATPATTATPETPATPPTPEAPAAPIEVATYPVDAKQFETKAKLLSRSNQVAVAGFRVGFVIKDKVTASVAAGYQLGGTHTSGAKSTTEVELLGVDYAVLQEIADQLHAEFIAGLKAEGREVVDLATLQAHPAWAELKLAESSAAKPYIKEASLGQAKHVIVVTGGGTPLWFENGNPIGDQGIFAQTNLRAMGALSADLGVVVLVPSYLVTFAELKGSGTKGGLFAGYKKGASTSAKPSIGLAGGQTSMMAVHAKDVRAPEFFHVKLKDSLSFGDYGAEMVSAAQDSNANSGSRAALQGLAQASGNMGFFAAAGATRSSQTLVVRPGREQFRAHALAALRAANTGFFAAVAQNTP